MQESLKSLYEDFWFLALLLTFLFGFFVSKAMTIKFKRQTRDEIKDLRHQLRDANILLCDSLHHDPEETTNAQKKGITGLVKTQAVRELSSLDLESLPSNQKIRMTKVKGRDKALRAGASIEGRVIGPIAVGRRCGILQDNGKILHTSIITEIIGTKYIKTLNSIYEFEHLGADLEPTDFEDIWERIKMYQGHPFHTKKGIEFRYEVNGNMLHVDRSNYKLSKSAFVKAYKMFPMPGPSVIKKTIRGASYAWAVLHDSRIAKAH